MRRYTGYVRLPECISGIKILISRISDYDKHAIAHDDREVPTAEMTRNDALMQEKRDKLDREGVMLWNRSTALKQTFLLSYQSTETIAPLPLNAEHQKNARLLVGLGMSLPDSKAETEKSRKARYTAACLVDLGSNKPCTKTG